MLREAKSSRKWLSFISGFKFYCSCSYERVAETTDLILAKRDHSVSFGFARRAPNAASGYRKISQNLDKRFEAR